MLQHLLGTGNKLLVGTGPYDTTWGIVLNTFHPDAVDPSRWRGQHLLGQAVQKARGLLRDDAPRPQGASDPTPPPSSNYCQRHLLGQPWHTTAGASSTTNHSTYGPFRRMVADGRA